MLAKILLRDLLDERVVSELTEYLSLSLCQTNGEIRISFTTTGSRPVTYATVIPVAEKVDFESLEFVAQGGNYASQSSTSTS
jgi:hypothetical protein